MDKREGVGYLRISDDREGRELGVQRQRADIEQRAARDGVHLLRFYTDNDTGASTKSTKARPDYARMLDDARAGSAGQFVYSYSNSRLTRRPREFEDLLDLHDRTGIRFRTVVSGDDDLSTADGRMVARMKAVIDAAESERLSERVRRKLQQNAAEGKNHGGSRPFGWNDDRRTLRGYEAAVLRDAASRLLLKESVRSICRDLTDRGVPTATWHPPLLLKPWRDVVLRETLLRPRIAGLRSYHGEIVGPGDWEPILDEPTWRQVQALLMNADRVKTPGRNGERHMLSGVVRCGVCGSLLRVGADYYRGQKRPVYRCKTGGGQHVVRGKAPLEQFVTDVVLGRLRRPDAAALLIPPQDHGRVQQAQDRLTDLEARQTDAAAAYAAGRVTLAQLVAINEALEPQLAELREVTALPQAPDTLTDLVEAPDPADVWERLGALERRAVVDVLLVVRVLPTRRGPGFAPESVEITWR